MTTRRGGPVPAAGLAVVLMLAGLPAGAGAWCPPPLLWERVQPPAGAGVHTADVAVDGAGNVIAVDTVVASSDGVLFHLVKYDGAGQLLWSRSWYPPVAGGSATSVAANASGRIAVGGNAWYGGVHTSLVQSWQPDGTLLWSRTRSGPGQDQVNRVAVNAAGQVAFAGWANSDGYSVGDWLAGLYDATGTPVWTSVYNSPAAADDQAKDVAFDAGGNVIVAGYEDRPDRGEGTNWLVRMHAPAGTLTWSRSVNAAASERASAVAVDGAGAIVVAGSRGGSASAEDLWIHKFDSAGQPGLAVRLGGPGYAVEATGLACAADGTYLAGFSTSNYTIMNTFRLDPAFNVLWSLHEPAFGAAVDGNGDVVLGIKGWYGSTMGLDVAKYRAYGPEICAVSPSLGGKALGVFPNPVTGDSCVVEVPIEQPATRVVVEVYSVGHRLAYRGIWTGVTVAERAVPLKGLSGWAPGRYVIMAKATLADGQTWEFHSAQLLVKR